MEGLLITREEFVNIMERMDRVSTITKNIKELLRASDNGILMDSKNSADIMLAEQDILIELLERVMNDKYKIIESFVLEQDFGRLEKNNKIENEDGSVIDLSTAEKVYDYLVEEMK